MRMLGGPLSVTPASYSDTKSIAGALDTLPKMVQVDWIVTPAAMTEQNLEEAICLVCLLVDGGSGGWLAFEKEADLLSSTETVRRRSRWQQSCRPQFRNQFEGLGLCE